MPLNNDSLALLKSMLRVEEDERLKPYRCPSGKLTIGVGRNLDGNGITKEEANYLLDNDIAYHLAELPKNLPFFDRLDSIRQVVLLDMSFNMGIKRLLEFKKTLSFIEQGDYSAASIEMLDSAWAKQVGRRALRLSEMMATGEYQELK